MKIALPSFTYPEPDPEDTFSVVPLEDLSDEAFAELQALHGLRIIPAQDGPEQPGTQG